MSVNGFVCIEYTYYLQIHLFIHLTMTRKRVKISKSEKLITSSLSKKYLQNKGLLNKEKKRVFTSLICPQYCNNKRTCVIDIKLATIIRIIHV